MRKVVIIIYLFLSGFTFGQNPFNNTFGWYDDDGASGIIINSDSNIVLTTSLTYNSNPLPSLIVLNSNNDSIDSFTSNSKFWSSGYQELFSSHYVSTGRWWLTNSTTSDIDLFVRKIDKSGNLIFNKTYGGTDYDYGLDFQILPDSGFLIVGTTKSYGAGGYDVYIIRTDKNGDSLWTRTYGNSQQGQIAYGIEKESDSVYVVAGTWGSNIAPAAQVFIMKINLMGDTLAFKEIGNYYTGDFGHSLCKTSDGGYAIGGVAEDNMGSYYAFMYSIFKVDSNLNLQWIKHYGNLGDDEAFDIKECYDHGFIMVGYSEQPGRGEDVYIVRTNSIGDTLWTRTLGGDYNDRAYSVVQTPDSGFAIVGNTYSYGAGGSDAFFLKLKPNGDITTAIGLPVKPKVQSFSIFPNPASSRTSIEFGKTVSGLMIIYSIDGKVLNKINILYTQSIDMDLSILNKGIYILKFIDENDNSVTYGKLIVQ